MKTFFSFHLWIQWCIQGLVLNVKDNISSEREEIVLPFVFESRCFLRNQSDVVMMF